VDDICAVLSMAFENLPVDSNPGISASRVVLTLAVYCLKKNNISSTNLVNCHAKQKYRSKAAHHIYWNKATKGIKIEFR
jgi:hypothetical protein